MKTTIYDLLGMIKDGKPPKKIKVFDEKFKYSIRDFDYLDEDFFWLFEDYEWSKELNTEVEILDEPKEDKTQKIYHCETSLTQNEVEIFITKNLNLMVDKINELIDEVNKLKENK